MDMCKETRDDGGQPLSAITAPSENLLSTVPSNFSIVYW